MAPKPPIDKTIVAQNRRARFDYTIENTLETGIVLLGSEVKSIRNGRASINESYAGEKDGELFLANVYIPPYTAANQFNHEARRPRKLLAHRREIKKLKDEIQRKGSTLVPLSMYFNEDGRLKVELGIAVGKKKADKRQSDKEKDWKRNQARILRDKN
ncbi:MAG: SsrA-binding protein SmpB [Alphaproteobacteria bacterium]